MLRCVYEIATVVYDENTENNKSTVDITNILSRMDDIEGNVRVQTGEI